MFGSTINLTVDGNTITLPLIEEANSASMYMLRENGQEYKLKINHRQVKENGTVAFDPKENHYVEFSIKTFATDTTPATEATASLLMRTRASDTDGYLPAKTLALFANAMAARLQAWEV